MAIEDDLRILRRVVGGLLALLGLVWFVAMMTIRPDYQTFDSLGPHDEQRDVVVHCRAITQVGTSDHDSSVEIDSLEIIEMSDYLWQHLHADITDDAEPLRLRIESACAEGRDRNLMFAMVAVLVFATGLAMLVAQGRTSRRHRFGASSGWP